MKTEEELNALKEEIETLKKKLCEITDDELAQVAGGLDAGQTEGYWECFVPGCGAKGGPLPGDEVLAAIRNHMDSTGHIRILYKPKN